MADMRLALGLMSGTSLDGIDAALLTSDGDGVVRPGAWLTRAYDSGLRERLRGCLGAEGSGAGVAAVERDMTHAHADAVAALLAEAGVGAAAIDVIGFHGHTIDHRPDEGRRPGKGMTRQIGDGALLAGLAGIDVVCDFRSNDVAEGGEGAPLAPLYHAALAGDLERPLAVLNLGGVGNVTVLGADGSVRAFDTGPGCALIDDWVRRHTGAAFDAGGALARGGTVHEAQVRRLMAHPYFERPPPKSLDRNTFSGAIDGLALGDGAATLVAFTARAVAAALDHLPAPPKRWLVTGGGRHNPAIMAALAGILGTPVEPVEAVGWEGDAIEAQAFAYLALRSLDGLPLTLPGTTGAPRPLSGGVLHRPS